MNEEDIEYSDTIPNDSEADISADKEYILVGQDYTEQLESIVSKQNEQIELITQQNALITEEINGISYIVNYLNIFFIIAVSVISVSILWNVLNKWFFRGV